MKAIETTCHHKELMKIQSNKENYKVDNLKSTTSYLTATSPSLTIQNVLLVI